jgi:putative hydrolase of the HAD superfamily
VRGATEHLYGSGVIRVIGFDGDDTLWHNEPLFSVTHERFQRLLEPFVPWPKIQDRLFATEMANLRLFGYGVKSFTLSMIETAIELSEGEISAVALQEIIGWGKEMLTHPTELLDGVRETVEAVARDHQLVLVTKGDLLHQESKIAESGLGDHFWRIEIVSEKDEATYRRVLDSCGVEPAEFLMVGNSVKSDIVPVVNVGARAVHIPYHVTWAAESADASDLDGWSSIDSITELPAVLRSLEEVGD